MVLELIKTLSKPLYSSIPVPLQGLVLNRDSYRVTWGRFSEHTWPDPLKIYRKKRGYNTSTWKDFPSWFEISPDWEVLQYSIQLWKRSLLHSPEGSQVINLENSTLGTVTPPWEAEQESCVFMLQYFTRQISLSTRRLIIKRDRSNNQPEMSTWKQSSLIFQK